MTTRERRDELRRRAGYPSCEVCSREVALAVAAVPALLDDLDAAEKRAESAENAAGILADAETRCDAWEAMARELAAAAAPFERCADAFCHDSDCVSCVASRRVNAALAKFRALESGK